MTYEKGTIYNISIIDFRQDPKQPRKFMDPQALDELAASIAKHGILEPVLFREGDSQQGYVFVVAGERRIEAAKKAGLLIIPSLYVDGNAAEIALVENLLRQDLTPIEEAEGFKSLMTEQNYNQDQLAGVIGKPRTTINETLLLNRLPQEVRDDCRSNPKIPKSSLVEISRKKQDRSMISAYAKLKEQLQKKQEGRKQRVVIEKSPEEICQWLQKTGEKISAIDTVNWTEEQRLAYNETLMNLQEILQQQRESSERGERPPSRKLA